VGSVAASGALGAKLVEIEALVKGVPGLALNGVQTLGGVKCYAKKEGYLARKEVDVCIDGEILSVRACKADRADVRRAFRSVLSYAVALAVGSTTILRTRPVTENGKVVAHCIDFAPTGALQPRRAPPGVKPIQLTYVADVSRFPAQPGTYLFPSKNVLGKGFKATDSVLAARPQIQACLKLFPATFSNIGIGQVDAFPCSDCGVLAPAKRDSTTPQSEHETFSPTRLVSYLQVHAVSPGSRTKMQEMQLLDHISGQCDRHEENFFVDGNGVYGIDLDMSWGLKNNPYGVGSCKLLAQAPYVAPDVLRRFDVLKNGGLTKIIQTVGRAMQVPDAELTAIAASAEARMTTVLAAVPAAASYTSANSLFTQTNERAQKCSAFTTTPSGAAGGQGRLGNQIGARVRPQAPPQVPGNGAAPANNAALGNNGAPPGNNNAAPGNNGAPPAPGNGAPPPLPGVVPIGRAQFLQRKAKFVGLPGTS
jgi:hypothetical protein